MTDSHYVPMKDDGLWAGHATITVTKFNDTKKVTWFSEGCKGVWGLEYGRSHSLDYVRVGGAWGLLLKITTPITDRSRIPELCSYQPLGALKHFP